MRCCPKTQFYKFKKILSSRSYPQLSTDLSTDLCYYKIMELQVENYFEGGQGSIPNQIWTCEKVFEPPLYYYAESLTWVQVVEMTDNGWLIQNFTAKLIQDDFDILFVKKQTENCFWQFTGEGDVPVYTLMATPTIDAEPQPAWQFLINKTWTYGDITTNILLILVLGVFVWDMLRRMFRTKF